MEERERDNGREYKAKVQQDMGGKSTLIQPLIYLIHR